VQDIPFLSYNSYLKGLYGRPAFRVGIDAGFSCPNRAEGRASPGCSYCDAFGARAVYQRTEGCLADTVDEDLQADIRKQTERAVTFLRKRYGAELFLLYFQAFSNTYGEVSFLKALYDFSLSLHDYKELIVSTRPDCIDRRKTELLASYKERGLDVWVELGLQSSNDLTLKRINRGHNTADFLKAHGLLREYGLKTAVHLIFGLPGEGMDEVIESCNFTAALRPEGVKFHNLHIPLNSPLNTEYEMGTVKAPSTDEHLEYVIAGIERMPEQTVIMRLTCDSPRKQLAAPENFMKKTDFYELVKKEMVRRKTFQGRCSGAT
jgi:radical SAM protein (TIGR01212 family)